MPFLRKTSLLLFVLVILVSCKHKKKPTLSGEDPVAISDFIEFFQPVKLPFQVSDTVLSKKDKDSLLINYKVFTQFVPDTVFKKIYGKGVKPKIYVMGKTERPNGEKYLFIKTVANHINASILLVFDNKQNFVAAMPALQPDASRATFQSTTMDRNFGIIKTVSLRNPDGSQSDGKDVYVFNPDTKNFLLVMTDALSDKVTELINPIDTLQRKHKWSADYTNGKMNMVSVRDGRRADRITFFIHFDKNNSACTGEIKGEAMIRSSTTAEFHEDGDPCVLKFIFSNNSVTLQEVEGCGSKRGLNCSLNGNFARKKYVKPVAKKTGSTK